MSDETKLTNEEAARLLECEVIPAATRALYALAIRTGCRSGETQRLRLHDLRAAFVDNIIEVEPRD